MRIKRGDTVLIRTGQYRGKTGKVLKINVDNYTAIVEGINYKTKHQRPTQRNPKGGMIGIEAPVHLSNLSLFVNIDGKPRPTRISRKIIDDGGHRSKVRVSRLTGEEI